MQNIINSLPAVVIKKKPSQDVPSEVLLKPFEHGKFHKDESYHL